MAWVARVSGFTSGVGQFLAWVRKILTWLASLAWVKTLRGLMKVWDWF